MVSRHRRAHDEAASRVEQCAASLRHFGEPLRKEGSCHGHQCPGCSPLVNGLDSHGLPKPLENPGEINVLCIYELSLEYTFPPNGCESIVLLRCGPGRKIHKSPGNIRKLQEKYALHHSRIPYHDGQLRHRR